MVFFCKQTSLIAKQRFIYIGIYFVNTVLNLCGDRNLKGYFEIFQTPPNET